MEQDLAKLCEDISSHYEQLLGFSPRRTKLDELTRKQWNETCSEKNLNSNASGAFTSRDLVARVNVESSDFPLNFFHEYFGHGLFYEYAREGRYLEKAEKRLLKDEVKNFRGSSFSPEELGEFRKQNPNFKILERMKKADINFYELFAIWTEKYLASKYGLEDKFEKKYADLPKEAKDILNQMETVRKEKGDLTLFYECGFPRYSTQERVKSLLKEALGEQFEKAKLVMLYGSRKPYSDVDIFLVGDSVNVEPRHYLDIQDYGQKEFEFMVSNFDVAATDAIMSGEFISGDRAYLETIRDRLENGKISKSAIYYNMMRSRQQRIWSDTYPKSSKESSKGGCYAQTYLRNALSLYQGKRLFTKKALAN